MPALQVINGAGGFPGLVGCGQESTQVQGEFRAEHGSSLSFVFAQPGRRMGRCPFPSVDQKPG